MRLFCENRIRSAVVPDRMAANRQTADYLSGYAEALADRMADGTADRPGGAAEE